MTDLIIHTNEEKEDRFLEGDGGTKGIKEFF